MVNTCRDVVFGAGMDSRLRVCERIEMPSPQIGYERHSGEGVCEKIEIAGIGETPQRHSREGGNPFLTLEQALIWVPACAHGR